MGLLVLREFAGVGGTVFGLGLKRGEERERGMSGR